MHEKKYLIKHTHALMKRVTFVQASHSLQCQSVLSFLHFILQAGVSGTLLLLCMEKWYHSLALSSNQHCIQLKKLQNCYSTGGARTHNHQSNYMYQSKLCYNTMPFGTAWSNAYNMYKTHHSCHL